jgi:hypothetical protein
MTGLRGLLRRRGGQRGLRSAGAGLALCLVLAGSAAAGTDVNPYYGFNNLTPTYPTNRCPAVLPSSHSLACSGFTGWDRTRVYKDHGGWIKVGFWGPGIPPLDYYFEFTGAIMTPPIVVLRTDVWAPPYNASFCGYDFAQTPTASSYVRCEAIRFF